MEFTCPVFAFEADGEAVFGVFEGVPAGIAMQVHTGIHCEDGGAIGLHEFERAGFGHVPFDT